MLLSEIRAYLHDKQRVSSAELSVVFGLDAGVLAPMVEHLVRKGWVRCLQEQGCRGCEISCTSCHSPLWYEWQGNQKACQ